MLHGLLAGAAVTLLIFALATVGCPVWRSVRSCSF